MAAEYEMGRGGPRMRSGRHLGRLAQPAYAGALAGKTVVARVIQGALLNAVLGPNDLAIADVVVDLSGIDRAVPNAVAQTDIVDRSVGGERSGQIVRSIRSQDFPIVQAAGVQAARRNLVYDAAVLKNTAPLAGGWISGCRVEDHSLPQLHGVALRRADHCRGSVGVVKTIAEVGGKVAGAHVHGWNIERARHVLALKIAIPIPEEEQLVLLDGPAECEPIIVENVLRGLCLCDQRVLGVDCLIGVIG